MSARPSRSTTALDMGSSSDSDEEDSPLLFLRPSRVRRPSFSIHQTHSPRLIVLTIVTIIFILAFGGLLMVVPCLRIWEDIICHNYYNKLEGKDHIGFDEPIHEDMCKGEVVQEQLNIFLAVLHFIGVIPGLVMTIPYGLLADRVGRRPVFILSITGLIIGGCYNFTVMWFWKTLPLYMIWASPIFILIGGGEPVATMMFFAIGNDVTTEANRSNVFLLGGCGGLFAELIAPSIASSLMARSPWIPIIIGLLLLIVGTSLILVIPETLHFKLSSTTSDPETSSPDSSPSIKIDQNTTFLRAFKVQSINAFKRMRSASKILHSLPVLLLLITFLINPFGRVTGDLSLRYISNRFDWKLRDAGYLLSMRAFVNIALLMAILPGLSHLLISRLHFTSTAKDLLLARSSVIFLILGAILMGLAPTVGVGICAMIVWTLGAGFSSLTRSLITTLVDQQHVGRLYAAISIVETTGMLVAGPIMAGLYALGLKWGGAWQGLPFLCLAVIAVVAGVAVWSFGWLTRGKGVVEGMSDEEDGGETIGLETDGLVDDRVGPV